MQELRVRECQGANGEFSPTPVSSMKSDAELFVFPPSTSSFDCNHPSTWCAQAEIHQVSCNRKDQMFLPENSNSAAMTRELIMIIMPITNSSIRTFQELSLMRLWIPTTKQFSPRQQKHCFSHNCLVQLIKCMELNMLTNHNQNGHKLQTYRMVG